MTAPIVSRAKSKWYKPQKVKKLALTSQLLTVQILTNDVQVLILCLSYFITTVLIVICIRRHQRDEFVIHIALNSANLMLQLHW